MNYEEWLDSLPMEITGDPLWTVEAYRLALFAAEVGWHDVTKLVKDKPTVELSDQLYRALGSIGANISEGYSRGGGRDRAHFYEYTLGSARESRGWYCNGRHLLGETVAEHRIHLLTQIIRLLLRMIPDQRSATFHEGGPAYRANSKMADPAPAHRANLDASLQDDAPLP
jgi:four helix bundle protein